MVQPDVQTLRAVHVLKGQPEFKVFLAWLQKSHEEAHKELEDCRADENFRVAQGQAQQLTQIISTVEGSHAALERAANTRP